MIITAFCHQNPFLVLFFLFSKCRPSFFSFSFSFLSLAVFPESTRRVLKTLPPHNSKKTNAQKQGRQNKVCWEYQEGLKFTKRTLKKAVRRVGRASNCRTVVSGGRRTVELSKGDPEKGIFPLNKTLEYGYSKGLSNTTRRRSSTTFLPNF